MVPPSEVPATDGRVQAKHRGNDPSSGQKLIEKFVEVHPRKMPKERSSGGSPSKEKSVKAKGARKRGKDAQAGGLRRKLPASAAIALLRRHGC